MTTTVLIIGANKDMSRESVLTAARAPSGKTVAERLTIGLAISPPSSRRCLHPH
jgi:hypothetical protein